MASTYEIQKVKLISGDTMAALEGAINAELEDLRAGIGDDLLSIINVHTHVSRVPFVDYSDNIVTDSYISTKYIGQINYIETVVVE